MYEILLHLPAKPLYRLRVVCQLWRSLLSDPHFIAASHPGPFLAVGHGYPWHRSDGVLLDTMDISGHVVQRVRKIVGGREEWVISTHLNFVCIAGREEVSSPYIFRLLDLGTGAVVAVVEGFAEQHMAQVGKIGSSWVWFGHIASTGQYKLLRVLHLCYYNNNPRQLCEVCTLNGSGHAIWRGKKDPLHLVRFDLWTSVVIESIVYVFLHEFLMDQDAAPDRIASFDLDAEEWRATLGDP